MFCDMASMAITSALWFTATSGNPGGAGLAAEHGLQVHFGSWLLASCVPSLLVIALLPLLLAWLFPPGITDTPDAPEHARRELRTMGSMSLHEKITAVTFAVMITGWTGRALPPGAADDSLLPAGVSGCRHPVDTLGRLAAQGVRAPGHGTVTRSK